jgi:arylsulfatase A-like enzyme
MKTTRRVISAILISAVFACAAAAQESRPNILFIAVDDLNDWIGCMGGHPDTKTPNLDRLAARGVLFTNASTPSPACIPARCAMMTGKSPASSGIYNNKDNEYRFYDDLKGLTIIPQYFSQQGYKSWGVGKVLHNFDKRDYDVSLDNVYWKNPEPTGVDSATYPKDVEGYLNWWKPLDVGNAEMKDWQAAEWVAGVLKQKHDKPFFLACGIFKPHEPWNVPRQYYEKFPLDSITLPKVKKDDLDDVGEPVRKPMQLALNITGDELVWRKAVQAYLANINFADECLGVILDALDQSPHKDNTIIVLWSDHGWQLGEKYRWAKFTLWERSARCVLMCAGPGITRNGRCASPVSLQDIYPTLIDLSGVAPKKDIDGRTFRAYLENPGKESSTIPIITANEQGFSLRSERYRYIRYNNGSEELYDHQNDPMEWNNLTGDPKHAEVLAGLRAHVPVNPAPRRNPGKQVSSLPPS